jgi:hypothetical protein
MCARDGGAVWEGDGNAVRGDGNGVQGVGCFEKVARGSSVDNRSGVCRREGIDCVGITLLLVTVKLLAVGTGVTGPLDQERREVQEDPLRGLGRKLVVLPPIMLVAVAAT